MTVGANFRVSRPSSVLSNASRVSTITSALKNVFRSGNGSSRVSLAYDSPNPGDSDNMSITSGPSLINSTRKNILRYQSSNSSIRSHASQSHNNKNPYSYPSRSQQALDTRSISSQKTGLSSRTGRTSTSKGGASGPPSSYTPRKRRLAPLEFDGEADESISSAEIRAEIAAVEEEKNQLMENFAGLEISTLTRGQGSRPGSPRARRIASTSADRPSSLWTVTPETASSHSPVHPHPTASTPSIPKMVPLPTKTGPSIIERKKSLGLLSTASAKFTKTRDQITAFGSSNSNSSSSSASHDSPQKTPKTGFFRRRSQTPSSAAAESLPSQTPPTKLNTLSIPPPASTYSSSSPTLPHLASPMSRSSSSPLTPSSQTRISSPPRSPAVALPSLEEQTALANIRRRREDTAQRYDQRLEFLRAKLRGAEIRERLMR